METVTKRDLAHAIAESTRVKRNLVYQMVDRLFETMREAIVSALLDVLNNERLQMEDAPGEGWAPIHAVER